MFCPVCRADYPDDWKRCPRDEATLLRSQNVGKYRIDKVIGVGGMGTVYKAYNPDTQSPVALKMINGSVQGQEAARARFQREAAAVAALRTRHAVNIFDFGADLDGTMYLVMEYLVGHPLRSEIAPPPHAMPLARIHMAFDGALRGLGAAHRAQITHRDLKPENIFIADTDDGEVAKVLDFGIARTQGSSGHGLTQSGALMGTPAYMAPEQVAGNRGEIGPWSDVYAMGVILYEMFAGLSPFAAESVTEVLSRVLGRNFAPLHELRVDLPPAVCDLVERAIADDHRERFPHADALREAWQSVFATFPPELRNATLPRFVAPGTETADLGSAPTQTPAALFRDRAPSAQMMTDYGEVAASSGSGHGGSGSSGGSGGSGFGTGIPPARTGGDVPVAAGGVASSNPSLTPSGVVMSTTPPPPKRRTALWAAIGVVAVGCGIGAYLAFGRAEPSGGGGGATVDAGSVALVRDASASVPVADAAAVVVPATIADSGAAPDATRGMAYLAGGSFEMGVAPSVLADFPDADAKRAVTVEPFWIDQTEMTVAAFRAAAPAATAGVSGDADDLPIRNVSGADAEAACKALGKRLPTEAEWEYAATRSKLDPKRARLRGKNVDAPSAVGIHDKDCTKDERVCDLLGNVSEWTADRWRVGDAVDPDPDARAVRGASYKVSPTQAWYASVHARLRLPIGSPDPEVGFRCARSP